MQSPLRRALPNAITMLRLVLAVVFFVVLEAIDRTAPAERIAWLGAWGMGLFATAALSDILDGHLARRWGVVSTFGRIMDPLVDKTLVLGGFIYLASPLFAPIPEYSMLGSGIAAWMVVVILLRELLVTGLRSYIESRGIPFPADWSGKVKMFAQSAAIPTALFIAVNPGCLASPNYRMAQMLSVWTMTAITVWSAVPYSIRGIALLRSISKDAR